VNGDVAFFEQVDENRFEPSAATASPWGRTIQHLGPCSALIARSIEMAQDQDDRKRLARVTIDALCPVPVEPVDLEIRSIRSGRRVSLFDVLVRARKETVLMARAWCLRATRAALPPVPAPSPLSDESFALRPVKLPGAHMDGYMSALDWDFAQGAFDEVGPARFRARTRIPLIEGEPLSPWQRTLIVADSAYGAALSHEVSSWPSVNTDLTVSLFRDPQGDWVGFDSLTSAAPAGSAANLARVFDGSGSAGHTLQTIFVS
jgi:hypothetical protein